MFKKTILFTALISLVFLGACSIKKEKNLSPEEAKAKAEQFINANFMDAQNPITITSVSEDEQTGLYKLSIDLGGGQTVDSYISKDGKKLYPQAYSISDLEKEVSGQANNEEASSTPSTEVSSEEFNEGASFETKEKVAIYFFWGDGCPHCASQKEAMINWPTQFKGIDIKTYETWNNDSNRETLEKMAKAYNTTVQGVPMTFIGDKYWVGYSDDMKKEMEDQITKCLNGGCENPGDRLK